MIDYKKKFSLKEKTCVVTGAAGLIGRETVTALAQAGGRVVIADTDEAKGRALEEALCRRSFKVLYRYFDIADLSNLKTSIDDLVDHLGGVDVWVNSAYPHTEDFGEDDEHISVESWRKNIDMHLNGYTLSAKFIAEKMRKKGGSIINLGSIYGVVGADPLLYKNTKMSNTMIYAAIKGGVVNFDRYLASYFGKYNVRVNTVCPGGVFDRHEKYFLKNYAAKTPLRRMAEASEVASVILFLSCEAASYITGATIMVDGGWTAI